MTDDRHLLKRGEALRATFDDFRILSPVDALPLTERRVAKPQDLAKRLAEQELWAHDAVRRHGTAGERWNVRDDVEVAGAQRCAQVPGDHPIIAPRTGVGPRRPERLRGDRENDYLDETIECQEVVAVAV